MSCAGRFFLFDSLGQFEIRLQPNVQRERKNWNEQSEAETLDEENVHIRFFHCSISDVFEQKSVWMHENILGVCINV